MENDIPKKLNPLLEILGLLYMSHNFEVMKADMIASLDDMNIDGEQFYKQNLSYLEKYVHDFKSASIFSKEDTFFFTYNTEFFSTVAAMALELFQPESSKISLEKQHIFSAMKNLLPGEKLPENNIRTLEEWFAVLRASEFSEDTKWRLLELLNNPVEKFQNLFDCFKNNQAAFDCTFQKNQEHLEKLISDAPVKISAAMQNIVSQFHETPKKIYLTAVFPLIEWLTPTMLFQGVLADKADLYQKNREHVRKMLPPVLKLLGDKSKFAILCLLKSHGKYNLEIAEELHLTPATASHHMSMLLSTQLVTVTKKSGKVYYQLNQETLTEIIECLKETLL